MSSFVCELAETNWHLENITRDHVDPDVAEQTHLCLVRFRVRVEEERERKQEAQRGTKMEIRLKTG